MFPRFFRRGLSSEVPLKVSVSNEHCIAGLIGISGVSIAFYYYNINLRFIQLECQVDDIAEQSNQIVKMSDKELIQLKNNLTRDQMVLNDMIGRVGRLDSIIKRIEQLEKHKDANDTMDQRIKELEKIREAKIPNKVIDGIQSDLAKLNQKIDEQSKQLLVKNSDLDEVKKRIDVTDILVGIHDNHIDRLLGRR